MSDTIERSQTHATFVIERTYPVPVEAVWHALSDNDARDQWFSAARRSTPTRKSHEFRVGGHGTEEGQWHVGRGPDSIHLHRHRRPAADRVRLRHVGRRAAPVHVPDHDRAGAGRGPDPADLHRAGASTSTAWTASRREEGTRTARSAGLLFTLSR